MAYDKQLEPDFDDFDAPERDGRPAAEAGLTGEAARAQSAELNALAATDHLPEKAVESSGAGGDPEADAARWADVERLLSSSPLGLAALERKGEADVRWSKSTRAFDPAANALTLDADSAADALALWCVQEMNFARRRRAGRHIEAGGMTRDAYISARLMEQVEGACLSIEAKAQMQAAGHVVETECTLEDQYNRAYAEAEAAGASAHDCREAARARVQQGFHQGEVVTGGAGQSYPEYYGEWWDAVHAE